jgi:integrase
MMTKNGHPRTIPLTPKAVEILASLEEKDERVFPVTPNAVRLAWERLRKRAGLQDLRLHDLRHEAVSRFFEYGLTVPEVALISGHRDPRMLSRYTHLRPEKVTEKLAKAVAG